MESPLIFHVLIAFGALQALFLAIVLLIKRKDLPQILFSSFLLIEGITLIERLSAETDLMQQFPHFLGVSYPINFIKSPILFFLAVAIINPSFRLRKSHLLHCIPFLLMLAMNIPFYMMSGAQKIEQVSAFIDYVPSYDSFNFWFFLSFYAYIGIYMGLGSKKLIGYKKHVKNNKLANWYLWVLYLYLALLSVQFIHFLLRPSGLVEFPFINEASMLLMTFLIQSIAYSFLSQSTLLQQKNDRFFSNVDRLSKDSTLIREKIESDKVYLDDTLSLEGFSQSIDLPKKYVSDIINQSFGGSFKETINKYRVEEAKRHMENEVGKEVALIPIGLQSGFNNKVSFYRTFKKYTGKSPSDYFQSLSK